MNAKAKTLEVQRLFMLFFGSIPCLFQINSSKSAHPNNMSRRSRHGAHNSFEPSILCVIEHVRGRETKDRMNQQEPF
jgi:hypothetical protein